MIHLDPVIAIDGPSGSGKSTVAKLIAERLNLVYIDTGSMFRAMGYGLSTLSLDLSKSILNPDDEKKVAQFLSQHQFLYAPKKDVLISLDGEDLTHKIRDHHVSRLASQISRYKIIRDFLCKWQREIVKNQPAILDGRDIGTIVFPNAKLKIFLTASAEERAQRRFNELKERGQTEINFDQILNDIKARDFEDTQREIAPLKKAHDALEINTTLMSIDDIVQSICQEWEKR